MTRDIEVLRAWLLVVVVIAAVGATSVPIIYSFSAWWVRPIGRVLMLQSVAFAGAMDTTVIFAFWMPADILVLFWVQALIFTGIAVSTIALAKGIWRLNHPQTRSFKLLFNPGVYEWLKRIVQIFLPALATLYFTVGQMWDLPNVEQVMGTITAVATFLGVCIGISSKEYNRSGVKYDGEVTIKTNEEDNKSTLFFNPDRAALESKDQILIKVNRTG